MSISLVFQSPRILYFLLFLITSSAVLAIQHFSPTCHPHHWRLEHPSIPPVSFTPPVTLVRLSTAEPILSNALVALSPILKSLVESHRDPTLHPLTFAHLVSAHISSTSSQVNRISAKDHTGLQSWSFSLLIHKGKKQSIAATRPNIGPSATMRSHLASALLVFSASLVVAQGDTQTYPAGAVSSTCDLLGPALLGRDPI